MNPSLVIFWTLAIMVAADMVNFFILGKPFEYQLHVTILFCAFWICRAINELKESDQQYSGSNGTVKPHDTLS